MYNVHTYFYEYWGQEISLESVILKSQKLKSSLGKLLVPIFVFQAKWLSTNIQTNKFLIKHQSKNLRSLQFQIKDYSTLNVSSCQQNGGLDYRTCSNFHPFREHTSRWACKNIQTPLPTLGKNGSVYYTDNFYVKFIFLNIRPFLEIEKSFNSKMTILFEIC